MTDPAPGAFVEAFADSGINLHLGFWIRDPAEGTLGIRSAFYEKADLTLDTSAQDLAATFALLQARVAEVLASAAA